MKIKIDNAGIITTIYEDDLIPLFNKANVAIRRASHVEPTNDGQWIADMSPTQPGLILGPYVTRKEALNAELEWLSNFL